MLPSDFKAVKTDKVFETIPAGLYEAQLMDVELETKPTFETRSLPIEEQTMEQTVKAKFAILEEDFRGRVLSANFLPTEIWYSKKVGKNKAWKLMEALMSKELDADEATMTYDHVNDLIGKQAIIEVDVKVSGDKEYSNIKGFHKSKVKLEGLEVKGSNEESQVEVPEETINLEDIPFG
jgi:hypothetical protein